MITFISVTDFTGGLRQTTLIRHRGKIILTGRYKTETRFSNGCLDESVRILREIVCRRDNRFFFRSLFTRRRRTF